MFAQLEQPFIDLALPFGNTRADQVRVIMGHKKSIKSVGELVKHFKYADRPERLDSPENRKRAVHMGEMTFPLGHILVDPMRYDQLVEKAEGRAAGSKGGEILAIVRPAAEYTPNAKGKARFLCAAAAAETQSVDVQPVLVAEDDVAPAIRQAYEWGQTLLVAARPYISDFPRPDAGVQQVFLYVARMEQIAAISADHWDQPPIEQSGQYTFAPHL
jgi:hypothetical protein